MAVWKLKIDWDRNVDFTGTFDDVTNRVIQCNWFLGMRKPYQESADNSLAVFVLNNVDRRYSPDNVASPLFGKVVPQRRLIQIPRSR